MQVGSDGGRHGWFKWATGAVPEGKSLTQSISLYDCMLVSMKSMENTPDFDWFEEKPNSDKNTRVLGKFCFRIWCLSDQLVFLTIYLFRCIIFFLFIK